MGAVQKLYHKEQEQGTELSIRKSQFKLPTELVALMARRHIYIERKIYLLDVVPWQNPDLEIKKG